VAEPETEPRSLDSELKTLLKRPFFSFGSSDVHGIKQLLAAVTGKAVLRSHVLLFNYMETSAVQKERAYD